MVAFFFFQAEDGIRDVAVTGVQTCALPICFLDNGVAGFHFTASAPLASFAASSSMTGSGIQTPQLQLTNSGFVDTLAGTWTASRTQTLPDNTGIVPVTSYLNSAYDNATPANRASGSNWALPPNRLNISPN